MGTDKGGVGIMSIFKQAEKSKNNDGVSEVNI